MREPRRDRQPLLVVVDDPHWADAPSLRFLEFLARRLDGLRHAEQPALPAEALRAGEAVVRRQGSRFSMYFMDHARAYWEMMFGSVTAAEAHARSALAITEEARLPLGRMTLVTMLAEVLIERDQLDEAEAHMRSVTLTPQLERVISGSDLVAAR